MSDTTSRLALPLIAAGQAQKHVPVNQALSRLDLLVQASAATRTLAVPPPDPKEGDTHIVASGAGGVWAGRSGHIAIFRDGGWDFLVPAEGFTAWVVEEQTLCVFSAGRWTAASSAGSQNLTRFGFGTLADAASPFTVKAERALLTAAGSGEAGDFRLVMNKDAAANIASLVLQSGYGGRAEIGLVGDDDLVFKVADEDGVWREALKLDRATGRVRFPQGGVREQLAGDRTLFVRADGSDANTGGQNTPGGAFRTIQRAYDVVASRLDLAGFTVTLTVGPGTFAGLSVESAWTGGGRVAVEGAGTGATILAGTGHLVGWSVPLPGEIALRNCTLTTAGSGDCIHGGSAGRLVFDQVEFAGCAGRHVAAVAPGACVRANGAYSISGGAVHHWSAQAGGAIEVEDRTVALSGTPAFTAFAQAAVGGSIAAGGNTFGGAASGSRYSVSTNGVLRTGGAGPDYLPGSAAGTSATGGQVV